MSKLTDAQQRELGPMTYTCHKCKQVPRKGFCQECDEYYNACGCPIKKGSRDDHGGHRTY